MKTTFKKALSLMLMIVMVVSTMMILPLTASAEVEPYEAEAIKPSGSGTEVDPYQISSPSHLVWMGQRNPLPSGYYKLVNDIDMVGVTNFKAIKANDSNYVFDGDNYAIKNLTVTDGYGGFWVSGFIGLSAGNTTIKNLKMENLQVDTNRATYGNKLVGGLVGQFSGKSLVIENCSIDSASKINFTDDGTSALECCIGGFVAYTDNSGYSDGSATVTIKNSTCNAFVNGPKNTEGVTSTYDVGGLIGVYGCKGALTIENCKVGSYDMSVSTIYQDSRKAAGYSGGLIGAVGTNVGAVTIKDSECAAQVEASLHFNGSAAGGFIGYYQGSSTVTFENCVKDGTTKARRAGGYIGRVAGSPTAITFTDCTSRGSVSSNGSSQEAAGFIARLDAGSCAITATNCVVEKTGNIWGGDSSSGKTGGFFGWLNGVGKVTMTDCVNNAKVVALGTAGGFIARIEKPNGLTMTRCINNGAVEARSGWEAGGFVGILTNNQSTVKLVDMDYCVNTGSVKGTSSVGGFFAANTNAMVNYDFNYCANTGALTTTSTTVASGVGGSAMGGLIGVHGGNGDRTAQMSFTARNCYSACTMTMPTPVGSVGGMGNLVGRFHYATPYDHQVTFENCYSNNTVGETSVNTCGEIYGAVANEANQTIKYSGCATGSAAADGIAKIDKVLYKNPDTSTAGGNLQIRMKLSDGFGFMAILDVGVLVATMSEEYGFCVSTTPFTEIIEANKIPAEVYAVDNGSWCFTYADLPAYMLNTDVYFAAYAIADGSPLLTEVRKINCLEIAEDLQDGKLGDNLVIKNPKERTLYTAMVNYYHAYAEYNKEALNSEQLMVGLPSVTNATALKTLDSGNGCKVAIYNDASANGFTAYCTALENAGFTKYSETNFNGSNLQNAGAEDYYLYQSSGTYTPNNYFATYVSEDRTIDLAFHEYDKMMYVSVSPTHGDLTLPSDQAPVVNNPLPITVTQIGTGDLHTEADMCYVIRLADGSFIVYDSGLSYDSRGYVADEIYKVLKKQAADPENIVISAFVLTHPHLDHILGFTQFAERYAGNTAIKIKQIVYNFPTAAQMTGDRAAQDNVLNIATATKKFGPMVELVKPRSGNVLYYPGVQFNVLYTQEDYLCLADNFSADGNASSLVMQMVTNDGTKVLFGGDHSTDACKGQLKYRYGSFLESYVVTLFHHGQGGGAEDNSAMGQAGTLWDTESAGWKHSIYAMAIKPVLVLWPRPTFYTGSEAKGDLYDQRNAPRNAYFTKTGESRWTGKLSDAFDGNVWNSEADASSNGVRGYFLAGEGIQIVTINGENNVSIATYDTRAAYYG